jgi:pimeloyl-CoA synthetase
MTAEELIKRLQEIANSVLDPENDRARADKLLLEYINDSEITYAYEAVQRWQ